MTALVSFSDMERMANAIAKSGLFGMKTADQVLALMSIAQGEGLHPAIAARDYHIISGRPALKADAMLARFQQAGGSVKWTKYQDDVVSGVFSHPAGGELEVTWTMAQAKAIGLATKDNWKNYPKAMLRARCISEGIRTVYPGCIVGVYTPEEVQDMEPARDVKATVVEVTPPAETYPVMVPGGGIYSKASSVEGWVKTFNELAGKVLFSDKLSVEEKGEKMRGLWSANKELIDSLPSSVTDQLRKELADE
jgi:hypothetical protein